ncbi:MAG TPA: hypothetical protein PKL31_12615 [Fulvivirga sp.]|nr:hypothetical protein [Fulvivirga sp.]
MDGRFLIYNGFERDVESIVKDLIINFNFNIINKSDAGVSLENKRVVLEISYETGLQIWLKIKRFNISEMIAKLCMFKGDSIYEQFKESSFLMSDSLEEKKSLSL